MNKKKLLIICNGPSTKNLDWNFLNKNKDKLDTFCVNSSYRKFEEFNFYPTYFGCFDYIVGKHHEKEFQKLLDNKDNNIKGFYFLDNLKLRDEHKRLHLATIKNQCGLYISNSLKNFNNWLNSGVNSLQIGCMLGYKEIYLIGVDGYKVKVLKEARSHNKLRLKITDTPKNNPNYFCDDYQRKGDVYNHIGQDRFQKPGWELAGKITKKNDIKVFNMGNREYIKCFDFIDPENFYKKI